jgi:hypothetical protein
MNRVFLAAFAACCMLFQAIAGCGIATHTEIAHRASYNFEYMLDNTTSIQKVNTHLKKKLTLTSKLYLFLNVIAHTKISISFSR